MQELNLKLTSQIGGGFGFTQLENSIKHLQDSISHAEVSGAYVAAAALTAAATSFVASKFFYNAEPGDEPLSKLGSRMLQVGALIAMPALLLYQGVQPKKLKHKAKKA